MAIYNGFFDAVLEDGKYDREYHAEDFTGYFGAFIGDGVCVYKNPDSMKVTLKNGAAVVAPGYLFIQGYWLKNDSEYTIDLPGSGDFRILAWLDLSRRMIDLLYQAETDPLPDDCLVLALGTRSEGTVALSDTRADQEVCGVVDALGDLSSKVAYAVDYIDNQVEARLDQAEADIAAKETQLDEKISLVQAQVEKIAPPPVGTVKFTASQNVGPEWLHCDGSFISEEDYPELVAALGKLTPGVEDYTELLQVSQSQRISNVCLYEGRAWVYLAADQKLVGLNPGGRKEITVEGVDGLNASAEVVLSISGGSLWLVQTMENVLEAASFTGDESALTVVPLELTNKFYEWDSHGQAGAPITEFSEYCYPTVTKISGTCYLAVGMQIDERAKSFKYAAWTAGSFSSTLQTKYYTTSTESSLRGEDNGFFSLLGFHPKNGNDTLLPAGQLYWELPGISNRWSFRFQFGCGSVVQNIFGEPKAGLPDKIDFVISSTTPPEWLESNKYVKRYAVENYLPQLNVLPVAANGEVFYVADINNRKITLTYCRYTPKSFPEWYEIPMQLPSRARLFKESVVYAQGVWFVFVGTGLLFSETLADGKWGYLATQDMAGVITQDGCLNYDQENNALYLSGMATDGTPKVVRIQLPEIYNFANDGAWLPMIASDGVPAYIKAKEPDESGAV